jgi:hypothetical protein
MKKFFSVIAALAILASGVQPANAKAWDFSPIRGDNDISYEITEGYSIGLPSILTVYKFDEERKSSVPVAFCERIGDQYCTDEVLNTRNGNSGKPYLSSSFVAGVCETAEQQFCIESVRIYKSGESAQAAEYVREVSSTKIPANAKYGTPEGRAPSIWRSPKVKHAGGGSDYSVYLTLDFANFDGNGIKPISVNAYVTPFTIKNASFYEDPSVISNNKDFNFPSPNTRMMGLLPGCVWQESGVCGELEDFSAGTRVGLSFRAPSELGGFFNGRLKSPDLKVSVFNNKTNKIEIDADTVEIGKIATLVTKGSTESSDLGMALGSLVTRADMGPAIFPKLEAIKRIMNDKFAGIETGWRLSQISWDSTSNKCFKKTGQLVGLVTTNAAVYNSGTPELRNGLLDYKVGGLHFLPDGNTETIGSYDLVLRSDVARCLYGFSKAPISATISISGDEANKVATTLVSEKNGWLSLAAYGFKFSSPTISVKITQPQPKKSTITCVKGRVSKKVTAVSPKCPSGYKKR